MVNPFDIVEQVSREAGVDAWEIRGQSRQRQIVTARKEAAKRLREAGLSLNDIGRQLGSRNHSTVYYLLRGGRGAHDRNKAAQVV